MTALVDSHAHIHDKEYNLDRREMLARAVDEGVVAIVTVGTDLASSEAAVRLAEEIPWVWAAVGIHPHEADRAQPEGFRRLEELTRSPRVVAIGEIGLDFYRDLSPRPVQQAVFEKQLDLADRLGLPVVIHSREADDLTHNTLEQWATERRRGGRPAPLGVMHCYSYGPERVGAYASLGLFISIAGTVTYPKAELVLGAAAVTPADILLVETDCPYLAPQSHRGRRNEPAYVRETADKVASLRGIDVESLGSLTTSNAYRLFGLPGLLSAAEDPIAGKWAQGNDGAS